MHLQAKGPRRQYWHHPHTRVEPCDRLEYDAWPAGGQQKLSEDRP